MPQRRIHLADSEATQAWGRQVAAHLRAGDLIVLTGDLGAGKTTFTRGLGEGLGVIHQWLRHGVTGNQAVNTALGDPGVCQCRHRCFNTQLYRGLAGQNAHIGIRCADDSDLTLKPGTTHTLSSTVC